MKGVVELFFGCFRELECGFRDCFGVLKHFQGFFTAFSALIVLLVLLSFREALHQLPSELDFILLLFQLFECGFNVKCILIAVKSLM